MHRISDHIIKIVRPSYFLFLIISFVYLNTAWAISERSIRQALDGFSKKLNQLPANIKTLSIAEIEFTDNERLNVSYLEDLLQEAITKSGRFTLIEREKLDIILREQQLSLTGLTREEYQRQVGKLASVDGFVIVKPKIFYSKWYPNQFVINIQIIETATSAIIWNEEFQNEDFRTIRFGWGFRGKIYHSLYQQVNFQSGNQQMSIGSDSRPGLFHMLPTEFFLFLRLRPMDLYVKAGLFDLNLSTEQNAQSSEGFIIDNMIISRWVFDHIVKTLEFEMGFNIPLGRLLALHRDALSVKVGANYFRHGSNYLSFSLRPNGSNNPQFFEHTYLESNSWMGFTIGLNTRISRNLLVAFDATQIPTIKEELPSTSFSEWESLQISSGLYSKNSWIFYKFGLIFLLY